MIVYADNAATTRVCEASARAMLAAMREDYGNPSSIHKSGRAAASMMREARKQIALRIGALPEEIAFTSGGTESCNWAIRSAAHEGKTSGRTHLITSAVEHPAVLKTIKSLETKGFSATILPVNGEGIVSMESLKNAIRADTALVSVMHANNETGAVQPIGPIGAFCRERGILFHTDAVQAAGKLPIDVNILNADYLSFSAHKFHGPKGIGVLFVKKGAPLIPLFMGGEQEHSRRAGTENVPGIVGMAAAFIEAYNHMEEANKRLAFIRDFLIGEIKKIPAVHINSAENQLPCILNICFEDVEGESLLLNLDMMGIHASSGSACVSGTDEISHVLLAMGVPERIAKGSLRLSFGAENTMEEAQCIAQKLPAAIERLRAVSVRWNSRP